MITDANIDFLIEAVYLLGFVVFHIKINHTAKATANPTHGVFMLKAAKKPTVAIIHVIKNHITVLMIVKLKC